MGRMNLPLVTALVLGSLIGRSALAAEFDLRPRFETGTTVDYLSHSKIDHHVRVETAEIDDTIHLDATTRMTLTVLEVGDDGAAKLEWRILYLVLTSNAEIPGIEGRLDYDSREPSAADSPLAPMLSQMIDQPMVVEVDPTGRVIGTPTPAPTGLTAPLQAVTQSLFSRNTLEKLPLFVTAGAPSPAPIRATWDQAAEIDLPLGAGTARLQEAYSFRRVSPRRKLAYLDMTGTMTNGTSSGQAAGLPATVDPLGIGATFFVDHGNLSASYVWDFGVGQLESSKSQMSLRTRLDSPLGRMVLEQEMNSTVKRIDPRRQVREVEQGRRRSRTTEPRSKRRSGRKAPSGPAQKVR